VGQKGKADLSSFQEWKLSEEEIEVMIKTRVHSESNWGSVAITYYMNGFFVKNRDRKEGLE